MSDIHQTTTQNTTLNDGSQQFKKNEFTKKTNLATESEKPEFEYNRPAPTTLQTSGVSTGGSAIADTDRPTTTTTTNTTYATTSPNAGSHIAVGQPSTTEQIKQKMSSLGHSIEEAVQSASQSINHAILGNKNQEPATTTSTQQYNTATADSEYNPNLNNPQTSNVQTQQQQGGLSSKLHDMMSHVGAALSQGHPVHAVTNATTAVKVGECERVKHERGPLADDDLGTNNTSSLDNPNFNASGKPYDNKSTSGFKQTTPNTFDQSMAYGNQAGLDKSSEQSTYTTSDKLHDMASHASAQLSHGHPITAITDAPAAARIAEAEKHKHAKGPINETAQTGQPIPSGSGQGSFGGVSGISAQGGASSTMRTEELNQKRTL